MEFDVSSVIRRLKWWPIVVGVLVDWIGTTVFTFGFFFVLSAMGGFEQGVDSTSVVSLSTPALFVLLLVGLLMISAGGCVAAVIANQMPVAHGTAVGVVSLLLAIAVTVFTPTEDLPLWYELIAFGATVPAGAAGGYLARLGGA